MSLPPSSFTPGKTYTILARRGIAVPLKQSQSIKIINTHGTQVIDTWAIIPPRTPAPNHTFATRQATQSPQFEFMSMCHTRASTLHLTPLPGDTLRTNTRQPILTLVEDSSSNRPGLNCVHDTLIAACDIHRYHELGVPDSEYHDNCADNFRGGLEGVGITGFLPSPPDPLNLWMNIPVKMRQVGTDGETVEASAGGGVSFEAPVSVKGDFVVLKADRDCVVVMSACPQDILKINMQDPKEAHFEVMD